MGRGIESLHASGERLRTLSGLVRGNADAVRMISASVSQQSAGVTQIFNAVTQLTGMMEATVSRVETTHAAAERLQHVTDEVTSLAHARQRLHEQQASAAQLTTQISTAEEELERIVTESRRAIQHLEKEKAAIEDSIARTLAYLSPIRRLPQELLAQIFTFIFDEFPVCAWVLGKVCSLLRRQVLAIPRLWSKVRWTLPFRMALFLRP